MKPSYLTHRTFTLHCRAAKHPRFQHGQRIEASMKPNQQPLTVGSTSYNEEEVFTAFFKLKVTVPIAMLEPGSIPEFVIDVPEGAIEVVEPVEIEPVPVEP